MTFQFDTTMQILPLNLMKRLEKLSDILNKDSFVVFRGKIHWSMQVRSFTDRRNIAEARSLRFLETENCLKQHTNGLAFMSFLVPTKIGCVVVIKHLRWHPWSKTVLKRDFLIITVTGWILLPSVQIVAHNIFTDLHTVKYPTMKDHVQQCERGLNQHRI